MSKKVLTGAERKAQLLEAGAKLASKHGAANVTRRMVATACKCAEGLVNRYMGDSATAQKAYARKAKAMGLPLPDKAKTEAIGVKLRKHSPKDKRDTRKRSIREVEAIKRKSAVKKAPARAGSHAVTKLRRSAKTGEFVTAAEVKANPAGTVTETKPTRPARTKPTAPRSKPAKQSPGRAPSPPETKSAARAPKAPPASVVAEDQPAVALPMPPQNSFP